MRNLIVVFLFCMTVMTNCYAIEVSEIQSAFLQKDYELSAELAHEYLIRSPKGADADQVRYYLGLSQLSMTQYQQARATFKALLKKRLKDDLYDRSQLGLIDTYMLSEQYELALKESQRMLKKKPDSDYTSLIYLKISRAHMKLSHWSQAKDYLNKILLEFPDSLEHYTARDLLNEQRFFAVQVGSFADQSRAEKFVRKLQNEKEYAYIVQTQSRDGKIFYRVRVGQLQNIEEAQELKNKLSLRGYPTLIYP